MKAHELKLKFQKEQTFNVVVVSTMSSGKSTFINALIGDELLPAENQACTARTFSVLDNDLAQEVTGHILFSNGKYEKIERCTSAQISSSLNHGEKDIADVIIECSIPGVRNIQRSLLIVDTPGVNNSMDVSHAEITKQFISSMSSGLIIYVLNATQVGTTDDYALLTGVKQLVEKSSKLDIIFVLNKTDELDEEKEPLERIVRNCESYLNGVGFKKFSLYPVSALAALLIKKALSGIPMTKKEMMDFSRFVSQFASTGLSLPYFAISNGEQLWDAICSVGKQKILRRELLSALWNTGIPEVERAIENHMIQSLVTKAPKVAGEKLTLPLKTVPGSSNAPGRKLSPGRKKSKKIKKGQR